MAEDFPCIILYGPRQCGKSTMIRFSFEKSLDYTTLDDIDELALAKNNAKLFLDSHPWPCVIDEIQKVPELLLEIKRRIDDQKMLWLKNGEKSQLMYILTSSNQFLLQNSISESLAGRAAISELNTFSLPETENREANTFTDDITKLLQREKEGIVKTKKREEVFQKIFDGGMPEYICQKPDRNIFFASYIKTYLEKDIRLLISQGSEATFRSFLSYVALRTAQELHYDELSSAIGVDVKTIKRWLSILEASGIISFLQPFMKNASNRIIKAPKLYFMDTGLCAYLCGWPDSAMLERCAMSGAFFETYVVSEAIKNFQYHGIDYENHLFYYHDIDQKEIDIIYYQNQSITPIEIKKGIIPTKPSKNFNILEKYHLPINSGLILDCTDKIRPINENVYTVPFQLMF